MNEVNCTKYLKRQEVQCAALNVPYDKGSIVFDNDNYNYPYECTLCNLFIVITM